MCVCADLTLNSLLEKIKHENANKIKKYIFKLNIFILYIYINNSAGQVVEWEHGEGGLLSAPWSQRPLAGLDWPVVPMRPRPNPQLADRR